MGPVNDEPQVAEWFNWEIDPDYKLFSGVEVCLYLLEPTGIMSQPYPVE